MSDEEKIELSPVEAITALNWKKSKVYYWISQGKFQTVERIDGQKIVLSRSELGHLRKNDDFQENTQNFETSENVLNNFDNFQNNDVSNITKNYNSIQNNSNLETLNFFQNSLNSIETLQQSFNYSLKLLTDGQNDYKTQYFELKAEKKTVEENLKKYQTVGNIKNVIIAILALLLIFSILFLFLISKNFIQFDNIQTSATISEINKIQNNKIGY